MGTTVDKTSDQPTNAVASYVKERLTAPAAARVGEDFPDWRGTVRLDGPVHLQLVHVAALLKVSKGVLVAQLAERALSEALSVLGVDPDAIPVPEDVREEQDGSLSWRVAK